MRQCGNASRFFDKNLFRRLYDIEFGTMVYPNKNGNKSDNNFWINRKKYNDDKYKNQNGKNKNHFFFLSESGKAHQRTENKLFLYPLINDDVNMVNTI